MRSSAAGTIVIAPDKFKGSLTATEAANAILRGVLTIEPHAHCELCPMADGGEGTVDVFLQRGAQRKTVRVRGPIGKPVEATFALNGTTAILEMSSASGLGLLEPSEYDPVHADTFGTGELIEAAINAGATRLIIGVGGSATNDAGIGMLRAVGVRFLDSRGDEIGDRILAYRELATIDLRGMDRRISKTSIEVAVDVDNPLYGPNGAAKTYAAQKGATQEQIDALDATLEHVANVAKRVIGKDYATVPGAGAAGGLGFALSAFLGAQIESGVRIVARECGLDELLSGAALCMTGEGKIDDQTLHGKTVDGVAALAREHGVPVVAFGGVVEKHAADELERRGVRVMQMTPDGISAEEAMRSAASFLESAAARGMRWD